MAWRTSASARHTMDRDEAERLAGAARRCTPRDCMMEADGTAAARTVMRAAGVGAASDALRAAGADTAEAVNTRGWESIMLQAILLGERRASRDEMKSREEERAPGR